MAIRDSGLPPREPQKPHLVPKPHPKRRRWLLWVTIVVVVILVAAGLLIYSTLRGGPLHRYAIEKIDQKVSSSLNNPVHINNIQVYPTKNIIDLYGVTIQGSNPNSGNAAVSIPNPPLLQLQHIRVNAPLTDLLQGKVVVNNIVIDHPVVHLIINKYGQTNLPTSSSGSSSTSLFDIGIRHAVIDNGEVYVNDRKNTLNADLHDLAVVANHDVGGGGQYTGTLSYANGHIDYDSYEPIPHALQAKFQAGPSGMTLSDAKLTSGSSQLMLNASVENYSKPAIHAKYVLMLDMGEVRRIMKDNSLPTGIVLVNGTADYNSVPGKAALQTAAMQGTISSHVLQLHSAALSSEVRELSAHYNLADGNAELKDVTARLLGGELTAQATVRNLAGNQQGHLVADLHDVSAGDLKRVAAAASLKPVAISGHVTARMVADWTGSIRALLLRADADATATVRPVNSAASAAVPVAAVIHATYDARTQQLGLQHSYVHMPATAINLNGTISRHSALQVQLHSSDLHQLETVAEAFAKPSSPLPSISGAASFDGTVQGTTTAPQIAGQLTASNLQFHGTNVASLSTRVQASPSAVSLQNGRLQLAQQQGRVSFNIQSALDHWSHQPANQFNINLNVTQLALAQLANLANLHTELSGTVNASVAAHGTELQPVGRGNITLRNASISGQPIQTAEVRFQGTGQAIETNLLVQVSGGNAHGQFTYYPQQKGYEGFLQATNIQLGKLQILQQRNLPMTGSLNLTANGRGTLDNPQGTASIDIPQLNVQNQKIDNISLQAKVANHEVTFNLGSRIQNVPLTASGNVALTGEYVADVTLNTPVIPLQPLLAVYSPAVADSLSGQAAIHATLQGPLKDPAQLQGQLDIPTLQVSYTANTTPGAPPTVLQLAAVGPIRANYRNGVVSLQPGEIKGTDTDVRFSGNLPLKNNSVPATITVQGGVDLAILQTFDPTVTSGGRMVFDINAAGYKSQPNVEGQIRIVNASFSTTSAPFGLANGNGVLTLRPDRIDITQFRGNVGGGTVTASGALTYRPAIRYDIALKGNDLRMLYPPTVRTDFGVSLAMTGNTTSALLAGQVNVNSMSFTPDFDLTKFITQLSGVSTPPPSQSFEDNLKLAIAIRSTSELNVVSPTVSIRGDANLRVIGTATDPVIVGRANLTGGDVIALGNRYVVQGGTVAFVNSVETQPVVNLQVNTTIQQYKITMSFRGPLDRLRTDYTSDPALAQADIIHLVAFGSTEEAANAAPSQSTALGAESLIASQVTSQVTSRLQKALGVSQISVDPQLASSTGTQQQGARITVRQRVTSKLYVTFSTDVTTTQYSAVQLQYQMNRKWSVSGVRDQNGGFGLDGRYHKEF